MQLHDLIVLVLHQLGQHHVGLVCVFLDLDITALIGTPFDDAGLDDHGVIDGVMDGCLGVTLAQRNHVHIVGRLFGSFFLFLGVGLIFRNPVIGQQGAHDGWHQLLDGIAHIC